MIPKVYLLYKNILIAKSYIILRCVIPLCWYNNTEILCIILSVGHNYISLSTVGKYNYMFRPYRWAIFRL